MIFVKHIFFRFEKRFPPLFRGDITWLTKLRYTYLITLHWSLTQFTPASMTVAWQQVPVLHRVNCIESLQDCNFEAFCSEVLLNQNISKHCWACPRCNQPIFTREGLMWRWWFLPWWPSPLLCCSVVQVISAVTPKVRSWESFLKWLISDIWSLVN